MTGTPQSCTCQTCVDACYRKPGWFLPGEAENVAKFLGLSLEETFRKYLAIDWWAGKGDLNLISPAVVPSSQDAMLLRLLERTEQGASELAKVIREQEARIKNTGGLLDSTLFASGAPGTRFRWTPTGRCIFLKNDRCSIHKVKPYECQTGFHDPTKVKKRLSHKQVAMKWKTEKWQKQCQDLLDGIKSHVSATNAGLAKQNTFLKKTRSKRKASPSSIST